LSLISRYVLREAAGSTLVVIAVLVVILMSNQFAVILDEAASDILPREAVFEVVGLAAFEYLTILMPIGLLLGVMLALARLNRDSEMVAMSSCGIGPAKLLRPIGLLTVALAVFVAWLALVQTPEASRRIEAIKASARDQLGLSVLEAGRFMSPDNGRTVVYAREVDGEELRDVFIEREEEGRLIVVTAERGERTEQDASGNLLFKLYNGRRTEGVPGEPNWLIAEFGEHGIPVRFAEPEEAEPRVELKPTGALLDSNDPVDRAELQWRLSSPVSLLVLALLAVPLSRSSPREGRFARVGAGLLLYISYANTISIARVWVERDQVPRWLGIWWVHALLALVALALLARESGAFRRQRFLHERVRREPAT
jgi:lipopolysaccharide export system permease protein